MYPVGFSEEDNDAKDLMVAGGGGGGRREERERGSERGRRETEREGGGISFLPLKRLRRLQGIIYPRSFPREKLGDHVST